MTRNVFDQYEHAENRLTHALLCALSHDRELLSRFLHHYAKGAKFDRRTLKVVEQTIPGIPEPTVFKDLTKSLPDGVIFEDRKQDTKINSKRNTIHALIIESKITSRLTNDQLQRHTHGMRARGFEVVGGLAITADPKARLPIGWSNETWSNLYHWLEVQQKHSMWSNELARFFEVLEAQMINDDSLGDRSLTRFNGIPFGPDHPYTYQEAKRLIRLLRAKLEKNKNALKRLGVDLEASGRKAIMDQNLVWDYFVLRGHSKGKIFTAYPHMTFSIQPKLAEATITVPNAVRRDILTALRKSSTESFHDAVVAFLTTAARHFGSTENIRPMIKLMQRRYKRQNAPAFFDAVLNVDLRTASPQRRKVKKRNTQPKYQPQWLLMAQEVIRGKASNLQFQIGYEFDYEQCGAIHNSDAEQLFVNAWIAARAFFNSIHVEI